MAEISKGLFDAAQRAGFVDQLPVEDQETVDEGEQTEEVQTPNDLSSSAAPKPEGDEDLTELPENYFGVNVREYAEEHGAEAGKAYYKALQDANRVASTRLQEIAELRKAAEEEARRRSLEERTAVSQPEEAELTDEELMEMAGMDASLLEYEELAKPFLTMARRMVEQERRLEQITQEAQWQATKTEFFSQLQQLETDHGKIPYDEETILEYAGRYNVADPHALYWAIMGPIRAQKAPEVPEPKKPAGQQSSALSDLKRQMSTPQRRGSAKGTVAPGKPKNIIEAYQQVKAKTGQGLTS